MREMFEGSKVSFIDKPLGIAFAEKANRGRSHYALLICRDEEEEGPAALYVELNDQSNSCSGTHLALVELSDMFLRIRFKPGAPLHAGRVGKERTDRLDELLVKLLVSRANLRLLRERLIEVVGQACAFRYVGHSLR